MYSDIVMLKYSNDHFNRKDKMCPNVEGNVLTQNLRQKNTNI